jgi:hydroxyacylglutathione hydrolase
MAKKQTIFPSRLIDALTGSNCYIIENRQYALIIDPNDFVQIQVYLQKRKLVPEWVILTHEHCDHIAGLNALREHYAVKVLASAACSIGIQSMTINMTRIMESYLYFKSGGKVLASYPRFICGPADVIFDNTYQFEWQEHHFCLVAAPGHTSGSICILVDNETLFSGDYFIPGEEVVTRFPGGSEKAYEEIGKKVLRSLPETIWDYPGHGASFLLTKEVKKDYGL